MYNFLKSCLKNITINPFLSIHQFLEITYRFGRFKGESQGQLVFLPLAENLKVV
jgi:hypothetical protein